MQKVAQIKEARKAMFRIKKVVHIRGIYWHKVACEFAHIVGLIDRNGKTLPKLSNDTDENVALN